jgi:hypothetical protein
VSGTPNRWKYKDIINYGFFPSQEFPVICYFKETATKQVQWNKWFAAFDSYGRGQPHFFPSNSSVKWRLGVSSESPFRPSRPRTRQRMTAVEDETMVII